MYVLHAFERGFSPCKGRLYDALETGEFKGGELAPRVNAMFEKKLELQNALVEAEEALNQHTVELADAGAVQGYVEELRKLLESSEIMEQKTFLRSFVEGVEVGSGEVKYKIPFVDGGGDGERVGVLPFIQDGSPASKSHKPLGDF